MKLIMENWRGYIMEANKKLTVGILPYRIQDEIQFLIGEFTNAYHAFPDEQPEEGFSSKWTCFKGKIDEGEDEKTAAKREFQEESTFNWGGELDDSMAVQNNKVKVWLVDGADIDASGFDRESVNKITGEYLQGMPEIWNIGWFSADEARSKLANSQKDLIDKALSVLEKKQKNT